MTKITTACGNLIADIDKILHQKPIEPITEIRLYKFIHDKGLEYHCNEDNEIILFVPNLWITEFNQLIRAGIDEESGEECVMKEDYFCFPNMYDFCEYNDILPYGVFNPKGSNH